VRRLPWPAPATDLGERATGDGGVTLIVCA
jgi:hypothetical protein